MSSPFASQWFTWLSVAEWTCCQMVCGLITSPYTLVSYDDVELMMVLTTPYYGGIAAMDAFMRVFHLGTVWVGVEPELFRMIPIDQDWQSDLFGMFQALGYVPAPKSAKYVRFRQGVGYY